MKKSRLLGAVCILISLISTTTVAVPITIDFEDVLDADYFNQTTPLTDYYAHLGVTFSGVDGVGGSGLTEYGNFGIDAHSGFRFFGFNTTLPLSTGTTELLSFSSIIDSFSIYAAGGFFTGTFLLEAFDTGNVLLASDTITTATWGLLSVASPGINTIKLTQTSEADYWVYDDMTFNTVPIPPSVWLFGSGLLGLVGIARRKAT
jgi:hypothetical protein